MKRALGCWCPSGFNLQLKSLHLKTGKSSFVLKGFFVFPPPQMKSLGQTDSVADRALLRLTESQTDETECEREQLYTPHSSLAPSWTKTTFALHVEEISF